MKTLLYWFSGTGNSLVVARQLAQRLGGTEVLPLVTALRGPIPPAERIGVIFPVLAFGPPNVVVDFVSRAEFPSGACLFSLCTMGGMAGVAHGRLRSSLKARGLELAAGWSIAMPGNCITLYPPPKEARQRKLFDKAARRLDSIAAALHAGRRGVFEDSWPPLSWIGAWLNPAAMKRFPREDKRFSVTDKCVHCGLCARLCPVSNIAMESGRPRWQGRCEQCFGCINWCPAGAIETGWITRGRRRYHHPDVKATEMCVRD
jgi:ferredoxin